MNTTDIIGRELYDHRSDTGKPDDPSEHVNVVDAGANAAVVARLHGMVLEYIQLW